MPVSSDDRPTVHDEYQAGRVAFERGNYRQAVEHLETARSQVEAATPLGGEVQIWLVTAYEALGNREAALDLCRLVSRHPDWKTRKEGKRLLYILEAPRLQMKSEWLTQIPDLSKLDESGSSAKLASSFVPKVKKPKEETPRWFVEPADPTKVNTRENQFVWVALAIAAVTIVSLVIMARS